MVLHQIQRRFTESWNFRDGRDYKGHFVRPPVMQKSFCRTCGSNPQPWNWESHAPPAEFCCIIVWLACKLLFSYDWSEIGAGMMHQAQQNFSILMLMQDLSILSNHNEVWANYLGDYRLACLLLAALCWHSVTILSLTATSLLWILTLTLPKQHYSRNPEICRCTNNPF